MDLIAPSDKHIRQLMTWFEDEAQLAIWSGPNFRYPFDLSSFKYDLKLTSLQSFSGLSAQRELLAFGQYYLREGKCHLGRLVVNPEFRGQGLITELIEKLSAVGRRELAVTTSSLFVFSHNIRAITAYEKLGFMVENYPTKITLDNCLYMVHRS